VIAKKKMAFAQLKAELPALNKHPFESVVSKGHRHRMGRCRAHRSSLIVIEDIILLVKYLLSHHNLTK